MNLLLMAAVLTLGVGDVHVPEKVTDRTPCVLLIHGGGWGAMKRQDVVGIADFLRRDLGCVVYNIDYRLASKENPWPACGEDCVAAAKFMFTEAFAQAAGVRPRQLWVMGGSAGGHLALWTGLSLPADQVAGIVSLSGIGDPAPDQAAHPARYRGLFGGAEPTAARFDAMNPMRLIRPHGPKILCTHATEDRVVPIASARNFANAYRAAGNEIEFHEYPATYQRGLTGHCIWIPGSQPHRLIPMLERRIAYFMKPSQIPEPQPVKTPYEISALYYPGTEHMPEWNMVEQATPWVKPLLGWYDESDPWNIDWQIKWAVEHGIHAFCVCWYWDRGVQRLDHWVRSFQQAKFRRHLKWYVMYANHNAPGAHSAADQEAVTKFWVENYFNTPEYYRIDGKPVVVYCSAWWNLDRDFQTAAAARGEKLGCGEGARRAMAISDRVARAAGFPGIYWINMNWLRDDFSHSPAADDFARAAGFDAQMSYNLGGQTPWRMAPELRRADERPKYVDYALMAAAARKVAEKADALPGIPFWPMLPTGYDDRSRAFQRAWVVKGVTTARFRAMCEAVKAVADRKGAKRLVVSPINEWQEGSYAEPNERFGFGFYAALRDVFCEKPAAGWPADLTPDALGLPRHEFPPMDFATHQAWTFDQDVEGWYRQPFGTRKAEWGEGCLKFVTTGFGLFHVRRRFVPFAAKRYGRFSLRLKVTPNARVKPTTVNRRLRLAWGTTEFPIIGLEGAVDFDQRVAATRILADGAWHEYTVPLADDSFWRGDVNEVWLEAVDLGHAEVAIDWMRFEK